VQAGHFVFMNLHDARAFCLPDGYEVIQSPSSAVAVQAVYCACVLPCVANRLRHLQRLLHPPHPCPWQVVDSSLDDVKRSLHPSFAPAEIAALDRNTTLAR